MTLRHRLHATLAGAFFSLAAAAAVASPQVVDDAACARYAVDIESFATCEDGKVVRPEGASAAGFVHVALQVVGDGACERHAVDIAGFATCEGDRVVRPAAHTVAVIVPVPATAQRDGHPTAAAGGPDGDRRGAPRDGGRANPFAPDERHREAWRLASAGPAGRAIGCDDAAPLALAQRR